MLDQPKYFYGLPEEEFLIVLYDIGKVTSSCMSEMHVKFNFGFSSLSQYICLCQTEICQLVHHFKS